MSKNKTDRQHHTVALGLLPITIAPIINLLCLLLMFFAIAPFVIAPTSAHINLPKTITSDIVPESTTMIAITSEDVIYFHNKVVTELELKQLLKNPALKKQPILIKADRRSSLARIIDVWNVCRELGLDRVNLATTINK
jgi:biopolymer transport protein ExbD